MSARPFARCLFAVAVAVFAVAFARGQDPAPTNPQKVSAVAVTPVKKPAGYPFAKSPLEAFDELDKAFGLTASLTADERKLIRKVWESKVNKRPLDLTDAEQIDLFLMASGVTDADERKEYRRMIATLRADCGDELEGLNRSPGRGERVFRFIRANLPKGYIAEQTRLSVALDDGSFNCVSVSVLMYLVGTHHGLDLRPMLCPGHAYLEWVPESGGRRAVVEGTNPDGFRFVEKMSPEVREWYWCQLQDYAQGREVDAAGLAGSIYSNRGAFAYWQPRRDITVTLGLYLTALALDPSNPDLSAGVEGLLVEWAEQLSAGGEKGCEKAVRLIEMAKGIAPAGRLVRWMEAHLRMLLWAHAVDSGDTKRMDERAEQAAAAMPDEPRFESQSAMYAWIAFRWQAAGGNWNGALSLLDRGLNRAKTDAERKVLRDQKAELFRQWSAELVTAGDLDGSLVVLAKAVKAAPYHPATTAALAHHAQAAAKHPKAGEHVRKFRERFPAHADTPTATAFGLAG